MHSTPPRIVASEHYVSHALAELGLSSELVGNVARAAAAGRNEALSVDPASAGGWLSYLYGVRALRLELIPQGWRMSRVDNVESTVHDERGIQLLFQNVDAACDPLRNPHAMSGKGAGSRDLIAAGQGELFGTPASNFGRTPVVWVVCVASHESSLRAEVSCPLRFEGDQFNGFSRRIFVIDEQFDPDVDRDDQSDHDVDEPDVPVTKR